MKVALLTTSDNPYNPFEDFDRWFKYDTEKGYYSCALLSRFARTSQGLSDEENLAVIEDAIDDIVKHDFRKIYKKVVADEDFDDEF